MAKHRHSVAHAVIFTGLTLSIVLHGSYNALSGGWGGTAVAAAAVLAFVSYIRTGEEISERLGGGEQADSLRPLTRANGFEGSTYEYPSRGATGPSP